MSDISALLKARRAKKKAPAVAAPAKKRKEPEPVEDEVQPEPVETTTGKPAPTASHEELDSDDDELDVHVEESYCGHNGEKLLFDIKRMRAVFFRHGFSKVQPAAIKAIDAHLKKCADEIVARAVLIAACSGRKQPTREDAITAVQQLGIFRNIVVGA